MTCRSCGAVIADKAIVCYKCGAPTAETTPAPIPQRPARRPLWLVLLLVAGIAASGWMAAQTSDTLSRVVWVAVAVVLAVLMLIRLSRR